MSDALFPSIIGSHWRASIARHRNNTEPNIALAQIREAEAQLLLQQGNGDGAGLRGRSDAKNARCSAASLTDEPKEGSRHALNNTQHPAPSDYGVGSHDLTFAATAAGA